MKFTYTAPNRSHHYPYAEALHRAGLLHAFISGFSRLSPRSPIPGIGEKLKRHDFYQTMYLASIKLKSPFKVSSNIGILSNRRLDQVSYYWAKESDIFMYYRTQGFNTTRRLHKEGYKTLCVMEEMNSHIDFAQSLMQEEYESLGIGKYVSEYSDHALRLKTYKEADCILCPSEYVLQSFISRGVSPERLIKVNYGFPAIENCSSKNVLEKKDTFRMLYVGQLHYRKGIRYAIEAFNKLKHPKKEFIIVGPKTKITGLENMKIPKGVVFTSTLKGEALNEQYRRANIFVLPSLDEGLALVQFEAMSFGLPLLITTNTGGDDLIKNGKEGFIVPPRNSNALAEKLQQMADDRILLEKMSAEAVKTAKSHGNWDDAVEKLILKLTDFKNSNQR